jgi:hypothetical protein
MPFPKLDDEQVDSIIQQVAVYIGGQRETYRGKAVALSQNHRAAMHPFFPASTLESARVAVLAGERVSNPHFYGELLKMGFEASALPSFADMAAITYLDTVVFNEPVTGRVLFHELVHVVQYEKLGLTKFAAKYVRGFLSGGSYEANPLEMNANELDGRFATGQTKAFSVAADVQSWIDRGRF